MLGIFPSACVDATSVVADDGFDGELEESRRLVGIGRTLAFDRTRVEVDEPLKLVVGVFSEIFDLGVIACHVARMSASFARATFMLSDATSLPRFLPISRRDANSSVTVPRGIVVVVEAGDVLVVALESLIVVAQPEATTTINAAAKTV